MPLCGKKLHGYHGSQSPQSHYLSRGLRVLWAKRSHPWHPLDLAGLQEAWRGWATKQGVCSRGSPAIQAGQGYSGTDPITQAARTWRVLDRQVLTILNDRNSAPAYFSIRPLHISQGGPIRRARRVPCRRHVDSCHQFQEGIFGVRYIFKPPLTRALRESQSHVPPGAMGSTDLTTPPAGSCQVGPMPRVARTPGLNRKRALPGDTVEPVEPIGPLIVA